MINSREAVESLLVENRNIWKQSLSGVRNSKVAEPKLNLDVLCMNWYNEVTAVDVCADMISKVESIQLKEMLSRQVSDELRHAKILRKYIAEKGGNVDTFVVPQKQLDLWQHLRSLNTPIAHFAAVNLVSEGMANDDLKEASEGYYDKETARLFIENINKDESFHFEIGKVALRELIKTEDDLEIARSACRSTLKYYSELVIDYEETVRQNSVVEFN